MSVVLGGTRMRGYQRRGNPFCDPKNLGEFIY